MDDQTTTMQDAKLWISAEASSRFGFELLEPLRLPDSDVVIRVADVTIEIPEGQRAEIAVGWDDRPIVRIRELLRPRMVPNGRGGMRVARGHLDYGEMPL